MRRWKWATTILSGWNKKLIEWTKRSLKFYPKK